MLMPFGYIAFLAVSGKPLFTPEKTPLQVSKTPAYSTLRSDVGVHCTVWDILDHCLLMTPHQVAEIGI